MTNAHLSPFGADAPVGACAPPTLADSGYLLLDPGAFSDAEQIAKLCPVVCRPTNWSRDSTGLPVLVDLAQCEVWQKEWLQASFDEAQSNAQSAPLMRSGICAHLESPVGISELKAHLASQMLVLPISKDSNRSLGGALWRFFDPRVFANLCWLLDSAHLAALIGPVSKWTFPWLGTTFVLDATVDGFLAPETDTVAPSQERIAGCVPIDIGLWERAQRISTVNQVLVRLGLPSELSWAERVAIAQRTEAVLADAIHWSPWSPPEDLALYAEHAMRYGTAFTEHPKLTEYRAQLTVGKTGMHCADAIALLSPDEYTALVQHAVPLTNPLLLSNLTTQGVNS